MPSPITLLLLGAQVEHVEAGASLIVTPAADYEHQARLLHAQWLAEPILEHQRAYAHALERWAKETRNRRARAHARKLLEES